MKKPSLIFLFGLGALALSACSGNPVSNNWPGLAADSEHAYIATGAYVYAVDLGTGREVWRYPEEANNKLLYYSSPAMIPDGQLLIGSAGSIHDLKSIDLANGEENWSFSDAKGAWVASPLVFNDRLYAPNTDGFVYVLDLNGRPVGDPIQVGGALWSAPATDGNLLYVASLDHHLHIIDPQRNTAGEPIDLGGAAPSSPVAIEGGIYAGSFASRIQFINSAGRQENIADATNWIWGTPALDGETLYYADLNGNVFSFDLAGEKQNWGTVQPDGPIVAKLLVLGDQIYVATEAGTLVALDREAKIVWEKEVGGKIYTSPVSSGELILVAPYQAEFLLAAYDAQGKLSWTFAPEK